MRARTHLTSTIGFSRLLCGVSSLGLIWAAPAVAQTAGQSSGPAVEAAQDEEIIVTGIRRAVESSIQRKRADDRIIDVITAEDIGKLPDQNVVETLQRVPGVQVNRERGGSQQNPSGEGQSFSIRGITQNRIEFNGTNITGAASSGGVQLADFTPDMVSAIEVIKSPSAEDAEGALGGVVNIVTRKPLEMKRQSGNLRIEGIHYDQAKKVGWRASGMFSAKLSDTFGIIVRGSRYEYERDTHLFSTDGWTRTSAVDVNGDGKADANQYRPTRLVFDDLYASIKRSNVSGAVQWKPSSKFEINADIAYTSLDMLQHATRYQLLLTDSIVEAKADDKGTIYTGTAQFPTPRVAIYNEPIIQEQLVTTFKVNWTPSSRWKIELAGSHSGGNQLRGVNTPLYSPKAGLFERVFWDFSSRTDLPTVTFPATNSAGQPVLNYDRMSPAAYKLDSWNEATDFVKNSADDLRGSIAYNTGWNWLATIKTGFRVDKAHLTTDRESRSMTPAVLLARNPEADADRNGIIDFSEFDGINLTGLPAGPIFPGRTGDFPRDFLAGNLDMSRIYTHWNLGAVPRDLNGVRVADGDRKAFFIQGGIFGRAFGMKVTGNFGVRYIDYKRTAGGWVEGDGSEPPVYNTYPVRFEHWLPSANLNFALSSKANLRLAAAKVVSNPPLTSVAPGVRLNTVRFTGSRGNPYLKPFTATQYDASFEWYFAPSSSFTLAGFYKDVDSFTVGTSSVEWFELGLSSGYYTVSEPRNGSNGSVRGFEVGYQHVFRGLPTLFEGMGVGGSYTFTSSKTPYKDSIDGTAMAMPGLSKHSYNATWFIEQKWGNLRLTYNWRDRYLDETAAASLGGNLWQQPFGHFDANLTYNLTKRVQLNLIGVNLTKTPQVIYQYDEGRMRDYRVNDRRIFLGVSTKF